MKKIRTLLDAEVSNVRPNKYAEPIDEFKHYMDIFVEEEELINGQKKLVTKKIENVKCPSDMKTGKQILPVEIGVNYGTKLLSLRFLGVVKGAK